VLTLVSAVAFNKVLFLWTDEVLIGVMRVVILF